MSDPKWPERVEVMMFDGKPRITERIDGSDYDTEGFNASKFEVRTYVPANPEREARLVERLRERARESARFADKPYFRGVADAFTEAADEIESCLTPDTEGSK